MTIKILSDKEHILFRPAMYVGSMTRESHDRIMFGKPSTVEYTPGLMKIISEIIDNSIDEAIRTKFRHANEIVIDIADDSITVKDNGRGIPQKLVTTPEGESIPGPVAAWTRTKAGSNFTDDRQTIGMNGVGSSLTNIFSKEFIGETSDRSTKLTVTCCDNIDKITWDTSPCNEKYTKVYFVPDFSRFDCKNNADIIPIAKDLVIALAAFYPKIKFIFNGEHIQYNFAEYVNQFSTDNVIIESKETSIGLATSSDGFIHVSYVNGVNTKNGGTHVDYIINGIASSLIPLIKKKYDVEVNKARIKECTTLVLFIRDLNDMKFDSQTKERLTSPITQVKNHVSIDFDKIAKKLIQSEGIIDPIIEAALARKIAQDKAAQKKAEKQSQRAKVAKHIKANKAGVKGANTTLFLSEGDSAIGYLISTRNRDLHGGYPLKGKILNTWGMSPKDMLNNKEIFEMCSILGLTFDDNKDINYDNIAIMTDADVDGQGAIMPAALAFFSNWPWLFDENRIHIVKTPIIIATKKDDVKWFYSLDEFDKEKYSSYKLRYIKGLGSLEESEYEKVINDPVLETVKLGDNWKQHFEMLFGNDSSKRKEWMSE